MPTPRLSEIKLARERARIEGDTVKFAALDAIYTLANREIVRCLDPRHDTTIEDADEAVFNSHPYQGVLEAINLARAKGRYATPEGKS